MLLLPVLFVACTSQPATIEQRPPAPPAMEERPQVVEEIPVEVEEEPQEEEVTATIVEEDIIISLSEEYMSEGFTQELYDNTLAEIKEFIENLNRVIQRGNFNSWRSALTDDYYTQISSPDFLASLADTPQMRLRNITIRSIQDYFNNVVMPSRANSRVDEIEFITAYRIRAFSVDGNRRLRLYELIKDDDTWKIAN